MKKYLYLTKAQTIWLKRRAAATGESESSVVRKLIETVIETATAGKLE